MQILIGIATATIIFWSCENQDNTTDKTENKDSNVVSVPASIENAVQDSVFPNNLFTVADAEKILGEPANLTENKTTVKKDTIENRITYTAKANDQKSGKTGVIYYIIEKYSSVSSAHNSYEFIRKMNENHEGVKILSNVADEAYFHSDGENFYFILSRKGDKMFRIKVNKITSNTSLDAFNQISKKIADSL
jgi:hypothetical protein